MKDKVIVISIDAMITEDIEFFKKAPNLGPILQNASYVKNITCVYPTLTYPCHATIATGVYPDRHGVCHNEKLSARENDRIMWYWFRDAIKTDTLLDVAKRAGLTTASVCWPVMGGDSADYTIPEIWAPKRDDDPEPFFKKACSASAYPIYARHKQLLDWMTTPPLDYFSAACAADLVREHQPDIMLVHLSYSDHMRHINGVHGDLKEALSFVDERIGEIVSAVKSQGLMERTNWVILGDHGQLYCKKIFNINKLFLDMGWLTVKDGQIDSYQVYSHSSAFSAQIYTDGKIPLDEVYQKLLQLQREHPDLIERVYTKQELLEKYHTSGDYAFMLEGAEFVSFGKTAVSESLITPVDNNDYKWSNSTHGHAPEKGDKPPFLVSGPDAVQNLVLESANLVDEAPTILSLLGLEMPNVDGTVLPFAKSHHDAN